MSGELLKFPCDFPLKVMGRNDDSFEALVIGLVEGQVGPLTAGRVRSRTSRDGNFLSVTLTVRAESQAQLDCIYAELSGHPRVLMVL